MRAQLIFQGGLSFLWVLLALTAEARVAQGAAALQWSIKLPARWPAWEHTPRTLVPRVDFISAPGTSPPVETRDLAAFNRWLCVTRLRAAGATAAFLLALHLLGIGRIALAAPLAACAALAVVSAVGLGFDRRMAPSPAFFIAQTMADLAAITVGIGLGTEGLTALLFRLLFALVIVPPSLLSVPAGHAVATAATACHLLLLVVDEGGGAATIVSVPGLAPPFLFFLLAQQCFFYGEHLARTNAAMSALATRLQESQTQLAAEGRVATELAATAHLLSATLETPDPLATACATIRDRLGADWCALCVLGPERTFRVRAATDAELPIAELGRVDFPLARWPALARLQRDGVLVLAGAEAREVPAALTAGRTLSTVLIAPLARGPALDGFLAAGYGDLAPTADGWTARLLAGIAEHASIVLQNVRLLEEVRAASALKSEFVGAVSHELRSPLNVILGYLEMTLDGELGPLTPAQADALGRTQRQAMILLEMISALLDLNRFESGRLPVEHAPVAIDALLADVCEQLPDTWRRPGVELRLRRGRPLPPVHTDAAKLKTVVRNLVHNALKFTTAGSVELSAAETPAGEVTIAVADTGPGIPPDALEYVFDMFRQVPGSGGGGVGLGLHIVRRFVDALGGRVGVESTVGVGTRFTVTLPVAPPAVADAA